MSGRLFIASLRLPRQAAADGRIDLMKAKCVPHSSHSQRHTLQRIYTQNLHTPHFHASIFRASQSRFGPSRSRKHDLHSSPEDLKAADGQEELRPSRKEKRRERERRVQERLNPAEDGKERSQKQNHSRNGAKQQKTGRVPFKAVLAVGAGFVLWQAWQGIFAAEPLNDRTFSPFEIVDRQQVSPTAFIITVKPVISRWDPLSGQAKLEWIDRLQRELARAGTWAVEIKQPELQVARDYTPLPYDEPSTVHEDDTQNYLQKLRGSFSPQPTSPTIKFLIRKTDGGEVSSWLSRRKVGDIIELRGPHQSFNVVARVGAEDGDKRVVFLAGGTGIAPALQTASSIFQEHQQTMKQIPQVDIIWANRSREDCRPNNPIIKLLEQLKKESRGKISYVCTVDEDGSFITANDIIANAQLAPRKHVQTPTASPRKSWFWASSSSPQANTAQPEPQSQSTERDDTNCYFHSPKRLITSAGEDYEKVDGEKRNPKWKCTCWKKLDGVDLRIPKFKNLLMVSGPEGFINHFAGPKYWADGKERQGPVGGVIGQLAKRYPTLASDWLVLKL